jgi:5-methylcytosine-specific restriction enzyme A
VGKKDRHVGWCELCEREDVEITVHHLTPKEMGGTFEPTANLCIPCHKQIHALYTNAELAVRLNTIALLRDDPQIHSFIKWIQKQPSSRVPKIKKSNERKKR